jgi:DNA gyrase/topoisomerase IV subunit A
MTEDNKKKKVIARQVDKREISAEMQESYLDYAMSVIVSRALPDVRDGLKPVHRRILYAMWEDGLKPSARFKKCASVIGSVLARYHPHGDMAVYNALVRMAQDFSLRYPLIEGQGNFGCFTGETEVRLTDRRSLSFKDLVKEQKQGKKHWGFTFNSQIKKIEITEIKKARLTRKKEKIIEVALDNGQKIKCTLDHRFMLRNGKYRVAEELRPGDSLMPLSIKLSKGESDLNLKGYEMVYQPVETEWNFVHRLSDEWNLKNKVYSINAGRIRHHQDFNKLNNNPDNILRVQWKDHWLLHKEIASQRHKNNPEYVKKIAQGRKAFWAKKENRELYSQRQSERNKKMWQDSKHREAWIASKKEMWKDPEYKEFMREQSRENIKNLWRRRDFQELMSRLKSKEMKERWEDEKYRTQMAEHTREISRELWANPKHREYISKLMKEKFSDPVVREKLSQRAKALWQDPSYRAKFPADHFRKMSQKLWNDPQMQALHSAKARQQWEDPEFRSKSIKRAMVAGRQRVKENPQLMKELAKKAKVSLQKKWKDPSYKQQVLRSKVLGYVHSLFSKYPEITPEIYEENRINNGVPRFENALNYFDNFSEIVEGAKNYNHKVVSIKVLRKREDVYDITTDPWHNFALAAGVFVHNSIDNDPPAAPRYSESKLASIGAAMLQDIEKETVDFTDNYDGTHKEPTVLPAPLPQLLLNGSSGIAVGMATDIPPHNLEEVGEALLHLIDHPKATTADLLQFVQGPDFPTGGIIYYDGKNLVSTYSTGRGSIVVRGKVEVVENEKGGARIIIQEIPYRVTKADLVRKIATLITDKKLPGVKTVRDESDREGIRVVIELSRGASPQRVLNQLYKHTDLQTSFHLNMVALVNGIQPKALSLAEILNYYLIHRQEVIIRRTKYDLARFKARRHILDGLIIALAQIDDVIATIKKSKDRTEARENLIKVFKFTLEQAEAILEIKLHRLARLEREEIEEELKNIKVKIKELEKILSGPKELKKVFKKELKEAIKQYGDQRRTKVIQHQLKKLTKEDLIPLEETFIVLTARGYIKRMKPESYRSQRRGGQGILGIKVMEGDMVTHLVVASTRDRLLLFSNLGKVYELPVYEIEEASRTSAGRNIANYLNLSSGEKVLAIINEKTDSQRPYLVMVTEKGIIKKTAKKEYQHLRQTGLRAITLKSGDVLKSVAETSGEDIIVLTSQKGKAIVFSEKEIRAMGRTARGLKGFNLAKDDQIISLGIAPKGNKKGFSLLVLSQKGYAKRTPLSQYRSQKRGGKGILTAKLTARTGDLIFAKLLPKDKDEELVIISARGQLIRQSTAQLPQLSRQTSGVRAMRLKAGDKVAAAVCFYQKPEDES